MHPNGHTTFHRSEILKEKMEGAEKEEITTTEEEA